MKDSSTQAKVRPTSRIRARNRSAFSRTVFWLKEQYRHKNNIMMANLKTTFLMERVTSSTKQATHMKETFRGVSNQDLASITYKNWVVRMKAISSTIDQTAKANLSYIRLARLQKATLSTESAEKVFTDRLSRPHKSSQMISKTQILLLLSSPLSAKLPKLQAVKSSIVHTSEYTKASLTRMQSITAKASSLIRMETMKASFGEA